MHNNKQLNNRVIIVLGGGINEDGTLFDRNFPRLELTAKKFKRGGYEKIIVSGRGPFFKKEDGKLSKKTEAGVMAQYLVKNGIPKSTIVLEENSLDTLGNILFSRKQYLEKNNWKKLLIISSRFHIARVKLICEWFLDKSYDVKFLGSSDKSTPPNFLIQTKLIENLLIRHMKKRIFPKIEKGNIISIEKFLLGDHPVYSGKKDSAWSEIMDKIRLSKDGFVTDKK